MQIYIVMKIVSRRVQTPIHQSLFYIAKLMSTLDVGYQWGSLWFKRGNSWDQLTDRCMRNIFFYFNGLNVHFCWLSIYLPHLKTVISTICIIYLMFHQVKGMLWCSTFVLNNYNYFDASNVQFCWLSIYCDSFKNKMLSLSF